MQTITNTFQAFTTLNVTKIKNLSIDTKHINDIIFLLVEFFGDTLIGLLIGGVIGWFTGWSIGHIYSELHTPIYFISFDVVNKWYYLPYVYAEHGANIGAAGGVLVILIIILRQIPKETKTKSGTK